MVRPSEYGARGIVAIGTPQGNPTVEQEMIALRPDGVSLVTARMYSPSPDPKKRLADYLDDLAETLEHFAELEIDVFGFACTGSTYLRGYTSERAKVAEIEHRHDYPVITAAAAIETELRALNAKRMAIVAPYPSWLNEMGIRYWEERGFKVEVFGRVALHSSDTYNIYGLSSNDALHVLDELNIRNADAVLFSGTGMPSLRALEPAQESTGLPVLSSNLCLARQLLRTIGIEPSESRAELQQALDRL
ncbi:MAG: hypothetical protein QNJ73_05055 [Gammaproteobacteria bacterium]|nr:hypothetical protein [Gammaproteobacteria bacterium]